MPGVSLPVTLVGADDPAWDDWLERVPRDVFHSAGYHRYASESGEGEPFLVIVGDHDRGFAWPYLLRSVSAVPDLGSSTAMDATSVYGYPGPLAWGCAPGDPFLGRAWSEIQDCWRSQGTVAVFTRFHPLLGNAALAAGLRAAGSDGSLPDPVVAAGQTVSVDLTLGYAGARAVYGRDMRRSIDRAREGGLVTEHDVEWSELSTFARLYDETMSRLQATEFYRFQEADFRRLRDELPGSLDLLVTRSGDTVAAAGLFTRRAGLVEWYLVGTDSAFSAQSPSKDLVDFAIEWAHDRGDRVLHLGGGRGGREDSLFQFKARFSPNRHTFHTGRWILDQEQYADLVGARTRQLEPGRTLDSGYFPAYRAPVIAAAAPGAVEP